jgi:hypothetical protein
MHAKKAIADMESMSEVELQNTLKKLTKKISQWGALNDSKRQEMYWTIRREACGIMSRVQVYL